mmetsp:Transcript_59324/g.67166  ORF Transcript_59324/g.67166 Transcript_59324/m.67166 type:complete len:155 (+) Transcript_59324:137-601(+)
MDESNKQNTTKRKLDPNVDGTNDVLPREKKKAKTSTVSYTYPVFETFSGFRCLPCEGGVHEKSVSLVGIFTTERDALACCFGLDQEAARIKKCFEDDECEYERDFSFKKTPLIGKDKAAIIFNGIKRGMLQPETIFREGSPPLDDDYFSSLMGL